VATVNWYVNNQHEDPFLAYNLLVIEPESVFKSLYGGVNTHFAKCPAFINALKNTYLVRSPIDVQVSINKLEKWADVIVPKRAPATILLPRFEEDDLENQRYVASLNIAPFVFYSEENVEMQLLPAFFEPPSELRVVCGKFNISKWKRPLEYAFELKNSIQTIDIKRGDPLFYLQFITDNDKSITLTRVEETEKDRMECIENLNLKFMYAKKPLAFMYSLREKLNNFRRTSKCPF
jgi:hypothetical protein